MCIPTEYSSLYLRLISVVYTRVVICQFMFHSVTYHDRTIAATSVCCFLCRPPSSPTHSHSLGLHSYSLCTLSREGIKRPIMCSHNIMFHSLCHLHTKVLMVKLPQMLLWNLTSLIPSLPSLKIGNGRDWATEACSLEN